MTVEAYRVGVSLLMDTGISNQLSGIIAQFEKLDAVVKSVNVATKGMADVLKGMNTLGAGMGGVAAASEKMAKAASDISRAMPDTTRQAEATASAMERAASASRALVVYQSSSRDSTLVGNPYTPYGYSPAGRPIPGAPLLIAGPAGTGFTLGPSGPATPSGGGYGVPAPYAPWSYYAGGPGPHTQWGGAGAVSPVGTGGGAGMPPLNYGGGLPSPMFGNFNGAMAGLYQINMGVQMVERFMELLGKAIDQAVQVNTELTRLHLGGVSEADRKALEINAYDVARQVPGRTTAQILADSISMRAIIGDEPGDDKTSAVRKLMPFAEKAAVVLQNATGEDSPEAMARLLKAVELRGDMVDPITHAIAPERFKAGLDAALDLLILGHGQITTNDLLGLAKQNSGSLRLIEDPHAAMASIMTPLLELGGNRTGTGLTAAMRALLGGTMAKHYAEEMVALGMTAPGASFTQLFPAAGRNGAVQFGKNFILDEDVLEKEGLRGWIDDVAEKNLAAKGITSQADIVKESYRLMNTETFRRIAMIYLTQGAQVQRDMELYKGVPAFDEKFNTLMSESSALAVQDSSAAFSNWLGSKAKMFLPAWNRFNHFLGGVFRDDTSGGSQEETGPPSLFHIPFSRPPGGYPWESSAAPPIDTHTPITMKGEVNLDGKKVGDFTASRIGDQASLPSAAPTGGDVRNPTPQPGWSWSLG